MPHSTQVATLAQPESRFAPCAKPRRLLLVKTSSLGDVVHALPVASDLRRKFPGLEIDWVVEEAYADIPHLHPAVRHVIPIALRRWRRSLTRAATWREMRTALAALRADDYDLILDVQGLVKSALLVAMTRRTPDGDGRRCGYGRGAARERLATAFYDDGFDIPKDLHAVERNRRLAAAACGYACDLPLDYGIAASCAAPVDRPSWHGPEPCAVLLTGTSREEKLWPEDRWIGLMASLAGHGLRSVLPAGSPAERDRAERLAAALPATTVVAPPLPLAALAGLCANARLVVGLDTGLTHLAVALGRPTLALFGGSDPLLTGAYAGNPPTTPLRNLGASGAAPDVAAACAAASELLQ